MGDPLAGLYCSEFLLFLVGIYETEDGGWCPGFDFCGVDDNGSGRNAYFQPCPVVQEDIEVSNAIEDEPEEIQLFRDFINKFVAAREQDNFARELQKRDRSGPKINQTYTENPLLAGIFADEQEQEDAPIEDDNASDEADEGSDAEEEADASDAEDDADAENQDGDEDETEPETNSGDNEGNANEDCAGLPTWMCDSTQ